MSGTHKHKIEFEKLNEYISQFSAVGRTDSAALLMWFLNSVFRLDEIESQDAVCDAPGDNGIDAIAVSDDQRQIIVLQAKRRASTKRSLGETQLKNFVGTLGQLATKASVKRMEATTKNPELRRLLVDLEIADKVDDGHTILPVFVTNSPLDSTAEAYLETVSPTGNQERLDVWDLVRLAPVINQLHAEWFVSHCARLKAVPDQMFCVGSRRNPSRVFAAIPATELIKLEGIDDYRVFAQNVRLSLGRTQVNRDIIESVKMPSEHPDFLAFHNGLTIVSQGLSVYGSNIRVTDYSVCNGCQSLLAFFNNRDHLSKDLHVLVRFVRVENDRDLAETIAYRTNNQNPISMRDLAANDRIQVQIKAEYDEKYGHDCTYVIKRATAVAAGKEIANEMAGRLVLSLYNGRPWEAHQKYRIFRDLYKQIFRYGINAPHIRFAQLTFDVISDEINGIKDERIRRYGLTKFMILYLVGEILREETDGDMALNDPRRFLSTSSTPPSTVEVDVMTQVRDIARDVIISLNLYLEDKGSTFDYKNDFKSQRTTTEMRRVVLRDYLFGKARSIVTPFKLP